MTVMNIDDLWIMIKIKLIKKDGDIYRYHYVFDAMDDDDGGIIELDQDVLKELQKNMPFNELFNLFADRRIEIIRPARNESFYKDGIDTSLIIAIKYIRQSFMENGFMPERIEILNVDTFGKVKERFPKEYDEIMNEIEKNQKKFSS